IALSALFPPFEVTAPVVLSQLFRTIDERYHSDALQCLLDFLIPSKHLLESVQQAACAGYSDVVFRCEGWPLCLHDKTVVQLAPVNPLLLRPGDFYLQVEPFGEQAARIVLKSLLEVGCREVEETPIPETSYPCMFSEEWLQDINEGRHGTPLSRCLLCTDQGVIKLPWASIAIPEFLERPKITPTIRETHPEPKQNSVPLDLTSSTLPVKSVVYPGKDKMSASLRPADSKLVKTEHERRASKSCSKPLIKPVGWVSPNTCDSQSYQEIEGDYVDLVEIGKGREFVNNQRHSHLNQHDSPIFNPVRLPPTMPPGNITPCALTLQYKEPCTPCSQRKLGQVLMDQDLKCRYRESYLAALKNPVPFERGNVNLTALEEEQLKPDNQTATQNVQQGNFCESCMKLLMGNQPCQFQPGCQPTTEEFAPHHCVCFKPESDIQGTPGILKSLPILSQNQGVQANQTSKQFGHTAYVPSLSNISLATQSSDMQPQQKEEAVKLSAKHKIKVRSLSTLSETPLGSPPLYKLNNRSLSDVCPEAITGMIRLKKGALSDQETLKLETMKCYKNGSRDRTGRAVVEVYGDKKEWMSPIVSAETICELLLYLHSIPRYNVRELGMTVVINAKKKPPPLHLYKALLMAQEQALHAVHSILILVDKDTSPRPEKQPGLQMDTVTSMKNLNKTVEASQLTSSLGGTFTYSHTDWLQFHQRLVPFMDDLRGADGLLQKAIKKIDCRNQMDTAQEVQQCIQERRVSMKEVLEDERLVTLQREGGALLARIRREEFRFPQSEDYRDSVDSVTRLYNQVEEKLHTLVMKSNECLQHLDLLFRLREMEAKMSLVYAYFFSQFFFIEIKSKSVFTAINVLCINTFFFMNIFHNTAMHDPQSYRYDFNFRRVERIMEELLSTEREYVKALDYVREHYFPELERTDVPQDLRGQRGSIFGNLEKLHDFHRHHFLDELESCKNEPFRVGRCFLRHRESFALYALYSKNKPQSDSLLINHGQTFFKQKQQKLGDKMDLWSYLLKPVQRISKYSLLLQDLIRECDLTQSREVAEAKAALEVIHFQLRHGNNLLAMDAILHCDVNLKEQGQLIRQDEFMVTFRKKKCSRHIFLFQELILFSKTRKTDSGNDTYIYKQSFKTSDIGMTQNTGDRGLCFEIWFRKRKSQDTYTLQAVSREVKEAWTKDLERILWEQAIHNRAVRMQERVFLGIGNKPFMDIQHSEAAISDRAVNYVLMGRGRPKSVGGLGGYTLPSGSLEEDDLDPENGNQNLLLDSSESSGESISGCSGHICTSVITVKEVKGGSSEKTQPQVAFNLRSPNKSKDQAFNKVKYK
uniref:Quattro n=1 Tax=Gouania willdenowi TaxID=441366 RepID=A0A8C5GNI1_GOUWI